MQKTIVIIGGGIAGLSAAYRLQQVAGDHLHLILLEAGDRWGGKIATDRRDGFVIEGGPDTFLRSKPWGVGLCRELGLEDRLHGTNPVHKNTYVLYHDHLRPLPEGLAMMVPSQVAPMARTALLSWPAKLRMGLDLLIPPKPLNGDESLGAFVSRRLGRSAYENLIEPLMSGIYAGDGDQLSLQATFPYLREMELKHGSLVRGALAARQKQAGSQTSTPASANRSVFLTPTTGLAEIVEALLARLQAGGADLFLNTPVRRILLLDPTHRAYGIELEDGRCLAADGLILAAPAYRSAEMLSDLDPALAAELQAIPYVSTATVSLAFAQSDLPRPLDGYGYVIPRREGRRALACTWTSTKFPHRAPEGYALLRVFVGRAGQEQDIPWDDAGLLELARQELRQTLGIAARERFACVYRWERAMPQYNLGHPARLQRIDAALQRWPALRLAGNGYRGIGIPDCIHSGEDAARALLAALQLAVPHGASGSLYRQLKG